MCLVCGCRSGFLTLLTVAMMTAAIHDKPRIQLVGVSALGLSCARALGCSCARALGRSCREQGKHLNRNRRQDANATTMLHKTRGDATEAIGQSFLLPHNIKPERARQRCLLIPLVRAACSYATTRPIKG
jgi:hypothetical protein